MKQIFKLNFTILKKNLQKIEFLLFHRKWDFLALFIKIHYCFSFCHSPNTPIPHAIRSTSTTMLLVYIQKKKKLKIDSQMFFLFSFLLLFFVCHLLFQLQINADVVVVADAESLSLLIIGGLCLQLSFS